MSIASIAGRRPNAPAATARKSTSWYEYPVLPGREKTWQVRSYRFYQDTNFGKEKYNFNKLAIKVVCLVPGGDEAVDAPERDQNAYRQKGHGMHLDIEFSTPELTPPGYNKAKDSAISPSGIYSLVSTLFYGGEEIPLRDIGRLSPPELKVWMAENPGTVKQWVAEYTATLEPGDSVPAAADIVAVMLPAHCLIQFLDRMVAERTQFVGTPEVKTRKKDSSKGYYKAGDRYNILRGASAVLAPEERLPEYRPFAKPADPREANDNPLVLCSVTGEPIRGWENSKGEWVSNEEWASMQAEILGAGPFTFEDVEGEFSPPFGRRYYGEAKRQVRG